VFALRLGSSDYLFHFSIIRGLEFKFLKRFGVINIDAKEWEKNDGNFSDITDLLNI